jgi:hypothetical protein
MRWRGGGREGNREGRAYLAGALKHLSLGVGAIDDVVGFSNLLHLLLGVGHPHKVTEVGVFEGVARGADFAVDLEAAADAIYVGRKGGKEGGREGGVRFLQ